MASASSHVLCIICRLDSARFSGSLYLFSPVPARWMLFHLELSRCSDEGVVEKSVCLEVGDRIQMYDDDTMNAVKYFDSVALHKYLPNKLPDLIFTKFDPIVSRLSEVLAASFTLPRTGPIGEDRRKLGPPVF